MNEADKVDPIESLTRKLVAWVKQQPEWLAIVVLPRGPRRACMRRLASVLCTIPTSGAQDGLSRNLVRRVVKAARHRTAKEGG